MTLSALYSIDCGMVTPICLAVLRLITSSNLVGCSTGRSAGLAPFRILSTKYATRQACWDRHSCWERCAGLVELQAFGESKKKTTGSFGEHSPRIPADRIGFS